MIKGLTKTLLAAGLIAASSIAAQAADYTIRATANSNENDEDYDGLVVFKNYVEAASNGAIEVELFIGTQLCSKGAECLQGVADGSIDVYISTSGGAAGLFPYVQVLDLPYLMADDRVAEAVLQGDFTRTMRDMALETSGDKIRLMKSATQADGATSPIPNAASQTPPTWKASKSAQSSRTCHKNSSAHWAPRRHRSHGPSSSHPSRPA